MATGFLRYRQIAHGRLSASLKDSYYVEPTFKLLDVIKQKHRRKLSVRNVTFA